MLWRGCRAHHNTSCPVLSFLCSIVKTWGLAWCDQVRAGLIYYHCHSVSALQSSRPEWADRRYKRRMVMQPDVMMRWDTQENCLSIRRTNMSKWNFSTSPHHYAIKLMKVCLWQGREQIMTGVYIFNDLTFNWLLLCKKLNITWRHSLSIQHITYPCFTNMLPLSANWGHN